MGIWKGTVISAGEIVKSLYVKKLIKGIIEIQNANFNS